MNKLTVRGFDDELSAAVRGLAKREGISLNQAALKLLTEGARASLTAKEAEARTRRVGASLDHLIGSWTVAEADEMNAALRELDAVDLPAGSS